MALEDAIFRSFVIWRIFPVVLVLGTIWYYKRKGVTLKSMKLRLTTFFIAKFLARFNKRPDILKMKDKLFTGLADQKTHIRKKLQILEIGAGGGANFTFYPSGSQIVCLDPNPNFESYLVESLQSVETSGVEMKGFIKGFAERMDTIEDNSLDAVVCSMVLCSVKDLNKALVEIKRVLKPDGKFYFLEHVAAERGTVLNRVQKLMNPAWHFCTGDCQISKETGRAIASAGFSKTWMEHFNLNTIIYVIRPLLLGTATK